MQPANGVQPLDIALSYARRGWSPVPIPHGEKGPVIKGWQKLRITAGTAPRYFNGQAQNVGIILGEASGHLADADLDCKEAVALAPCYLPPTEAIFGRAGKPRSHWLYLSAVERPVELHDPDNGEMLVELRTNGGQTVFPGSTHPSGEEIEWADDGDPAPVDPGRLAAAVKRLAAACLLLRHDPQKGRHYYLRAVSGWLLRNGWKPEEVKSFLLPVARLHLKDRERQAEEEIRRLVEPTADRDKLPGFPKLVEHVGEKRARKLAEWLGVERKAESARREGDLEAAIDAMNERYAVVAVGGRAVVASFVKDDAIGRERLVFSRPSDVKLLHKHKRYPLGGEMWDLGSIWLGHERRRTFDRIALVADGAAPPDVLNLWRGFGVEPKAGGWSTIRDHLLDVVCAGNEEHFGYLLRWLARCVQKPDKPAEVAVVMRGRKGTGKGLFAKMMRLIFRDHYGHIAQARHLTGHFNAHLADTLFLFVDEAFWAGDKQGEAVLKALVTEEIMMVEPKGLDPFAVPNRLKILMASNSEWVVPATADERRFFVLDVSDRRRGDHAYFAELARAIEGDELPAFLDHLLSLDLDGFNHRAVPRTKALDEQKLLGSDSVTRFWLDCLGQGTVVGTGREAWPADVPTQELHAAYVAHAKACGERHPLPAAQMAIKLRKLAPRLATCRPRGEPSRQRRWQLPGLDECRAAFLAAMDIAPGDHDWGDGPGDGPGGPGDENSPGPEKPNDFNARSRWSRWSRQNPKSEAQAATPPAAVSDNGGRQGERRAAGAPAQQVGRNRPDHLDHLDHPLKTKGFSGPGKPPAPGPTWTGHLDRPCEDDPDAPDWCFDPEPPAVTFPCRGCGVETDTPDPVYGLCPACQWEARP